MSKELVSRYFGEVPSSFLNYSREQLGELKGRLDITRDRFARSANPEDVKVAQSLQREMERIDEYITTNLGPREAIQELRTKVKGLREQGAKDLEAALTEMANVEFSTMFKPKVRQSLSAAGILHGGALREVLAAGRGQMESEIGSKTAQYKQAGIEEDLSLGLEELKIKYGSERESLIKEYGQSLSEAGSELASQLYSMAKPGLMDYLFQGASVVAGGYQAFSGLAGQNRGELSPKLSLPNIPTRLPFSFQNFGQQQQAGQNNVFDW